MRTHLFPEWVAQMCYHIRRRTFFLETIEQVQCDMQCDVDATRDMNHWEQQAEQGKAVYFSSGH